MLGRAPAFEEFYRQQHDTLLRAVVYALEDRELGLEATDEAFTRAFERWDAVRTMANPAGWVFRVAVNFGSNRLKRRGLEQRKAAPVTRDLPDIEGVGDPALARALLRLPVDQRTVVVLRFHLDWSTDEIAAALDCAPGTVKSRLHRALRRLEKMVEAPA